MTHSGPTLPVSPYTVEDDPQEICKHIFALLPDTESHNAGSNYFRTMAIVATEVVVNGFHKLGQPYTIQDLYKAFTDQTTLLSIQIKLQQHHGNSEESKAFDSFIQRYTRKGVFSMEKLKETLGGLIGRLANHVGYEELKTLGEIVDLKSHPRKIGINTDDFYSLSALLANQVIIEALRLNSKSFSQDQVVQVMCNEQQLMKLQQELQQQYPNDQATIDLNQLIDHYSFNDQFNIEKFKLATYFIISRLASVS